MASVKERRFVAIVVEGGNSPADQRFVQVWQPFAKPLLATDGVDRIVAPDPYQLCARMCVSMLDGSQRALDLIDWLVARGTCGDHHLLSVAHGHMLAVRDTGLR